MSLLCTALQGGLLSVAGWQRAVDVASLLGFYCPLHLLKPLTFCRCLRVILKKRKKVLLQGMNFLSDALCGELCFKWLSCEAHCTGSPGINQSRVLVTKSSWWMEFIHVCLYLCRIFISLHAEQGEQRPLLAVGCLWWLTECGWVRFS